MSHPPPSTIAAEDSPKVLSCGSSCTALTFTPSADSPFLLVGSEDGALRSYAFPFDKVHRAVKALGGEISCVKSSDQINDTGIDRSVLEFDIHKSQELILKKADAKSVICLLQDQGEDDVLNDIAVESGRVAFTSDSGVVGVYNLESKGNTPMKTKHSRISSAVKFIPNTSGREIVSSGYDCTILHHEIVKGSTESRRDIPPAPASSGSVNMCPPFVLSVSISGTGMLAAGTADGRVWICKAPFVGPNGGKPTPGKQIKWKGMSKLDGRTQWEVTVAQGPVTAIEILQLGDDEILLSLSLSGRLQAHRISSLLTTNLTNNEQDFAALPIWEKSTRSVIKTNGMASSPVTAFEGKNGRWIAVGGVGAGGKGFVEIWFLPNSALEVPTDSRSTHK
ncbi:hypothetical protein FRB97_007744 [Tulasnella sp. 331]|nr:hypothetical protein FRB97_007744 [Tulasnella sp. 331]